MQAAAHKAEMDLEEAQQLHQQEVAVLQTKLSAACSELADLQQQLTTSTQQHQTEQRSLHQQHVQVRSSIPVKMLHAPCL